MALPRELVLLQHGFEAPGACYGSGDPFDDATASERGAVWYDHGYVDGWESASPLDQFLQPRVPTDPAEEPLTGRYEERSSETAPEVALVHGEEAAVWSALGRRALFRRVEED